MQIRRVPVRISSDHGELGERLPRGGSIRHRSASNPHAQSQAFRSVETTYPPYEKMLEHFKITAKDPHERVAALRSIPAQDLVQFAATTPLYGGWAGTIETGPNATWPVEPAEAIRQGCFGGLEAVFLGNNEHEGTLFGPAQKVKYHSNG